MDWHPEISAATGTLAFVRHLGGYRYTIRAKPMGGGAERVVLAANTGFWGIAWTANGREILFGRPLRPHQEPLLWRVPAAGGEPALIEGLGAGMEPTVSPDGTRLAYQKQYQEGGIRRYALSGHAGGSQPERIARSSAREWSPAALARPGPSGVRLESIRQRPDLGCRGGRIKPQQLTDHRRYRREPGVVARRKTDCVRRGIWKRD